MKWVVAALVVWLAWQYLRPRPPAMAADELAARQLLGVGPRANPEAIRTAHRRLLAEAHPDRGGAEDLARELNAARDLLLSRAGRTGR